ncbi:site-specific integrase [Neomoorella humiferrea]|uniref:tyrosine-type recombinase/integrase n=1 Tax=Neomoorella humiferrea TaxID=676965 RepID=UPI003D93645E
MPRKKKGRERGNGEGTISQRKDGTWCAAITAGRKEDGKLKRVFFYGKTREEVAQKLTKALADIQQGTYVEPSKLTVGEWLDTWLKDYARPHIRPSTWQNYEMIIRVHIKPAIGGLQLKQLQATHLQRLYNDLREHGRVDGQGGLSARTVRITHVVIHAALKQAMKEGLVARNVAEATTLPRQQKKELRVLTLEEEQRFMTAVAGDRLGAAFLLDLATGMRLGELLALRWQDVDLKEGVIRVRRALSRVKVPDGPTKTALIFQEPKTAKGKRSIPLPEWAIATLKAHKARQAQEKLLLGPAYQDNGLVFATEEGKPVEPRNFTRKFYQLREKAGLPKDVNFHALRHTYATRLLEANEHPKVVQELLGHSQISMTLDTYSHVLPELKKAAAAKLNNLWPTEKIPSIAEGK